MDVATRITQMPIQHADAPAYLAYRAAFGRPADMFVETFGRYWAALEREVPSRAPAGPVDLDWSIVVLRARRAG